jgi:hypothetical protein
MQRYDWVPLGGYGLQLRTTKRGRFMVDRVDYYVFDGRLCTMNQRPLDGPFLGKAAASDFAASYVRENPGHWSVEQARAKAAEKAAEFA